MNTGGTVLNVGAIIGHKYGSAVESLHVDENTIINITSDSNVNSIGGVAGYLGYSFSTDKILSSKASIVIDTSGSASNIGGLAGAVSPRLESSYVSNTSIKIENSSSIQKIGSLIGGTEPWAMTTKNSFSYNSTFDLNRDANNIGSLVGYGYSYIQNSFSINSAVPNYNGTNAGSLFGYLGYQNTNTFTDGDIANKGTNDTTTLSIIKTDVTGNKTHNTYNTWDFDAIWEVVPEKVPKFRDSVR